MAGISRDGWASLAPNSASLVSVSTISGPKLGPPTCMLSGSSRLTTQLNEFVRARARYGKGKIPNELVAAFRQADESFARLVRTELDRDPLA
jgi:hypothetical protein